MKIQWLEMQGMDIEIKVRTSYSERRKAWDTTVNLSSRAEIETRSEG